jgi:fibronectin-binding autotransporter adhesin
MMKTTSMLAEDVECSGRKSHSGPALLVWIVMAVVVMWLMPQAYGAPDFYVTDNGTGSGTGWGDPTSLTNALATAAASNVIWMKEGTYTNASTFTISTDGLGIYGGFDGTETLLSQRDWDDHPPLLDGQVTHRVLNIAADNVLLDGVVVTNGWDDNGGSGLRIDGNTGLSLLNCRITGNEADGSDKRGGGAYFLNAGDVLVSNCVFLSNFSTFRNRGLGFYSQGTDITVVDSEIRDNVHRSGDYRYGAGFNLDGGSMVMRNTIVADNDTKSNDSNAHGGGGYISGATASFTNCLFTGNKCGRSDGGALFINSGSTTIDSCTFANNSGFTGNNNSEGGAIYVNTATVTIKNTIFWDNQAGNDGSDGHTIYQNGGTLNISYSCLNDTGLPHFRFVGGTLGDGIITNDPLFATEYTDLHLQSTLGRWNGTMFVTDGVNSPCIDAGDPTSDFSNEPAGENGGLINLGAYGNTAEASKSPNDPPLVETLAARVVATAAELKGQLTNGAVSTATFYYGLMDKGATAVGWDATNAVSGGFAVSNVFTSVAGGLQASQTYWFRAYATNAFGDGWGDAVSFTTGAAAPGGGAGVIHVDADAVGVPDGLSWTNAFTTFEDALTAADEGLGTSIWVSEGVYLALAKYDVLTDGLSVYGGFSGTETSLGLRDWTSNEVALDGGGARSVMDIQADNVLLDGLVITNGFEASADGVGIRMNNSGTGFTMLNCRVVRNRQNFNQRYGAGAWFYNAGNVLVSNCVFQGNYSTLRGRGVGFASRGTTLTMVDSEIRGNYSTGDQREGKGFYLYDGTLNMLRCTVADQYMTEDNSGPGAGGYIRTGTATFTQSIFSGNQGTRSDGGGLFVDNGNVTIESCTFANNSGKTSSGEPQGGAIYVDNGTVNIKDSIFWDNLAGTGDGDTIYQNAGTLNISYCLINGTAAGDVRHISGTFDTGTVITSDPLFATEYTDLHLQSTVGRWNGTMFVTDASSSPAIDAGDPASDFSSEPVGENGGRINLGAYGNTAEASKSANDAPDVETQAARVVATAAELTGELTSGADSTVIFYYGLADAGAMAVGWDATNTVVALASEGSPFTSVAGMLQASQTYWYRVYATNGFGEDWGDPVSFTTGTAASGGGAGVLHVDADAGGVPDGTSWTNAFTTFADALDAAEAGQGTSIWVAEGTYVGQSIIQTNGLAVYGGFAGTETSVGVRDIANNESVLDAGAAGVVLDIQAANVLLDGLVITNGFTLTTDGVGLRMSGYQDLTMLNCRVVGNIQNHSDGLGGGAYFLNAGNVLISNCVFQANRSTVRGLGLGFYSRGTTLSVVDCEILANTGGGDARPGAGFYLYDGALTMRGTTVADNDTNANDNDGAGGGGYIRGGTASFTNCVFTGNRSERSDGGALYVNGGSVSVDTCTLANNGGDTSTANCEGGAIFQNGGTVMIKNSILWDNDAGNDGNDGDAVYQNAGTLNISYTCINGTTTPELRFVSGSLGDGLITVDPLFATEYTDVHLQSTVGRWDGASFVTDGASSPCLDAGDPASAFDDEPAGENGARINLGAYGNTAQASKSANAAPAVTTLVARVVATAAELKGELTGGADSTAIFYYGLSDQGVTAAGWDTTNVLGALASVGSPFTSVAGALQASQTYWFRAYATNAFGESWGDAVSFATGVAASGGGAGVIHVDADAGGVPDGLSWTNAFPDVADALAAADAGLGTSIWIAEGTYAGAGYVVQTNGLAIYGGFSGAETGLSQRDWVNMDTLLDGGGAGGCILEIQADDVLLDALIITNGFELSSHGAGIRMNSGGQNLTLLNCRVVNNTLSLNEGKGTGAYFLNAGTVLISNCVFQANRATSRGKGIGFWSEGSTILELRDCEIRSNYDLGGDQREGKGFRLASGTLIMVNTTVADHYGSDDNSGPGAGGYIGGGTASFTNCIFTGNDSTRSDGGALYIGSGNVTIESCTFAGNIGRTDSSEPEGGAIYQANGTVTINNSIFWGNDAGNDGSDGDTIYQANGSLSIAYSCLEGTNTPHLVSASGTLALNAGIITDDPLFAVEYTDVHLQSSGGRWNGASWVIDAAHSPCIDAGDPASDFSREPIRNGGRINMGAYGNTAEASLPPRATIFMVR